MRVHGMVWSDTGGKREEPFINARDLNQLGEAFQLAGHEFKYWDRYMINDSIKSGDGKVLDCDLLLVHVMVLIRYGGHASKNDANICRLMNEFRGPVILFTNDQLEFSWIKNSMKDKFGDDRPLRPVYIADDRACIHDRFMDMNGLDIAGHVRLNQSWPMAWHWLDKMGIRDRVLNGSLSTPSYDFIYGGEIRKRDFVRRLDSIFEVFGHDNCISYGNVAKKFGFENLALNGKSKFCTVGRLMELNSKARYSGLPYDEDKDYITSRCFEQGFADCLVLCDKGYNQEDCGFPVVDYMDGDAIAHYRDLPEQERIRMVRDQHERLTSIDYIGRCRKMIDDLMETIF